MTGHAEAGVAYAQTAVELEGDSRYDPFEPAWRGFWQAAAYSFAGQVDRALEVYTALRTQPGLPGVVGLCGLLYVLPVLGRAEEARAIAEEAVSAARAHGNPFLISFTLQGYVRAFTEVDPTRALNAVREGLACAREHRVTLFETVFATEEAGLEAVLGDVEHALLLFDGAIDSLYRAGNVGNLANTIARLAVICDRIEQPEVAATLYGACTHHTSTVLVNNLPAAVDHLRAVLGDNEFDRCVNTGAAMELAQVVLYARTEIEHARLELGNSGDHRAATDAYMTADQL